ncbi:ATP phosphoribosyltransferase [Candidatus Magnetomorum sp. HK-1]|nr:ATP phosphoribosyltransferase [Candidatus Magnetomorum sp. HK-1]
MISLSLPKGDALPLLAEQLKKIDFPLEGYRSDNRTYRPKVNQLAVRAKIMAEKDVALQVAAGNYDIGFCGQDWIQEHLSRFNASDLQNLFKINSSECQSVFVCSGKQGGILSIDDLKALPDFVDIVSEYPNLAEHFAIQNRLKRFRIFPAWGSVEAYPPEHAHVVILKAKDEKDLEQKDLFILEKLFDADLCLVVNQSAYKEKDLSPVLKYLLKLEAS